MREDLKRVQEQFDTKQAELEKADQEKETLEKENSELRLIGENLAAGVKSATDKRNKLAADVKELEARGFTAKIMKKIGHMEAKSGAELLLQSLKPQSTSHSLTL
jgi:chromosome segregation ATPase